MPHPKPKIKYVGEFRVKITESSNKNHPFIYKVDSPIYRNASIYSRGGIWYTRLFRNGNLYRKKTIFRSDSLNEEALTKAISVLHSRYELINGLTDQSSQYEVDQRPTMIELVQMYVKSTRNDSPASRRHFTNAVRFFIKDDFIISEDDILIRFRKVVNTTDAKPDTVAKYLNYLKNVTGYAVEEGYLTTNPLLRIKVSRDKVKPNSKEIPDKKDVATAVNLLEKSYYNLKLEYDKVKATSKTSIRLPSQNFESNCRFIRILNFTAMRPIELAKLTKEDLEHNGFLIRSTKTGNRVFPYLPNFFDGVKSLIIEQANQSDDNLLFPYITYSMNRGVLEPRLDSQRNIWKSIQLIAGFSKIYRLYDLRAIALNRWEKEYGFSEELINEIGGNTTSIRTKYYRAASSIDDMFTKYKSLLL